MESTRRQMSCGHLRVASIFLVAVLSANTIHATPLHSRSQDSVSASLSELSIEEDKITTLIDQMLRAILDEAQSENSRDMERKLLSLLDEVSTERGILRRIRQAKKHHAPGIIYPESLTDKIRSQIRSVKYVRRMFRSSQRGDDSNGCVLKQINSGVSQNDAFRRCQRT